MKVIFSCYLVLISLFLYACNVEPEKQIGNITILPVEFSSGAPLSSGFVSLNDSDTGEVIELQSVSKEGKATFTELVEGQEYTVQVIPIQNGRAANSYASSETFTFSAKQQSLYVVEAHSGNQFTSLSVPTVMQMPEYPTGCEITSMTAVLNYYGINISKMEMVENHLPKEDYRMIGDVRYGPDPNKAFSGHPSDSIIEIMYLRNQSFKLLKLLLKLRIKI